MAAACICPGSCCSSSSHSNGWATRWCRASCRGSSKTHSTCRRPPPNVSISDAGGGCASAAGAGAGMRNGSSQGRLLLAAAGSGCSISMAATHAEAAQMLLLLLEVQRCSWARLERSCGTTTPWRELHRGFTSSAVALASWCCGGAAASCLPAGRACCIWPRDLAGARGQTHWCSTPWPTLWLLLLRACGCMAVLRPRAPARQAATALCVGAWERSRISKGTFLLGAARAPLAALLSECVRRVPARC